MARDKLTEYDATAANNTVVGDVNLAENSALPSDMNNAVREVMSHLKAFASGTDAIGALTVTGDATVNGAFTSRGIDDNADATAITIDSSERVGIATPATSNARCLLHTHPSGTGSIPTNYLVQQDDNNLGLVIMNTNDSSTYSGLRIETRSNQAAGWLVANEFQSAFNGDLVFRARNAGSTSAEIARMKSSGGITFNGDTAAANALDDYEEGTFTPSFISGATGITYTERSGRYTKIGNMVHFQIFLNVNASTTNSGGVQIGGLPFTSFNGQPLPSYSIGYNNNFHGGSHTLTALGNSNTTTISLYQDDGSQLTGSESNFGNDLYISGSYIAA